ncbi:hypothetical protein [Candidatus Vondammii sp. HM_W22]|uniref:hypothetical protein n=1 Tax=Candidatus Vondammii sp. HM_W22 TaxID=2687299 RepID=UPI002E7BCE8B|nr:hypothetical protein [Candidatus Vondammii sp. HM_W22]
MNTPKDKEADIASQENADKAPAGLYAVPDTPELNSLLVLEDTLHERLQAAKEVNPDLWPTIVSKLRVDWTYNSNTIEGCTLSRGETHFFLTEGLTVEGKPLKDFTDAQNHAEAMSPQWQRVKKKAHPDEYKK